MPEITFRAMGCQMLAMVEADTAAARAALDQAPAWFEAWEQCLSRFRPDSELMRLNGRPGEFVPVSQTLWEVLEAAGQAESDSGGLVRPTLLAELRAAGSDRSFDEMPLDGALGQPLPADYHSARSAEIQRDRLTRAVCLPPGLQLDFGGLAKGWAADQAAARLLRFGPALVDAGGDIALGGMLWPVGVADPLAYEYDVATILLNVGGLATSGRDYRRWRTSAGWQHHLIDPRTGQPAVTAVLSATVVAPSARQAEIAAKTALILGPQAGLDWLNARPELAGLLVLEDGEFLASQRLGAYLAPLAENLV